MCSTPRCCRRRTSEAFPAHGDRRRSDATVECGATRHAGCSVCKAWSASLPATHRRWRHAQRAPRGGAAGRGTHPPTPPSPPRMRRVCWRGDTPVGAWHVRLSSRAGRLKEGRARRVASGPAAMREGRRSTVDSTTGPGPAAGTRAPWRGPRGHRGGRSARGRSARELFASPRAQRRERRCFGAPATTIPRWAWAGSGAGWWCASCALVHESRQAWRLWRRSAKAAAAAEDAGSTVTGGAEGVCVVGGSSARAIRASGRGASGRPVG